MKKIVIIAALLILKNSFAQQILDGFSPIINDFTTPLKSGVYTGDKVVGKVPDVTSDWNHLFVIRHSNQTNNYQLQIGSSYSANDRLFFRKIGVNSLSSLNPSWTELATRGANLFNGNQTINGNLDFFNYTNKIVGFGDPNNYYIGYFPVTGSAGLDIHFYGGIRFGDATSNSVVQIVNGKVGIGITNPNNKLDVNGTIHSKEVKVDMNDWSDFVFKKDYALPTLDEVEKHIAEKGHLENIPSEEEVLKNGINLGEMNSKLLQKIEELTLYIIQQEKKYSSQSEEIEALKKKNKNFEEIFERLSKIESHIIKTTNYEK
ncbi:hypothetical protein [Flavobacterium sp. 2]|uniref:hypothetical protein n=1 Tax=Flavobacterium sp. 2 TaxID=308053 RepID=UPI003CF1EB9E